MGFLRFLKKLGSGLAGFLIGVLAIPFILLLSIPLSVMKFLQKLNLNHTGFISSFFKAALNILTWGPLLIIPIFLIGAVVTLTLPFRAFARGVDAGLREGLEFPFTHQPVFQMLGRPVPAPVFAQAPAQMALPQDQAQAARLREMHIARNANDSATLTKNENNILLAKLESLLEVEKKSEDDFLSDEEIEKAKEIISTFTEEEKKHYQSQLESYLHYRDSVCEMSYDPLLQIETPVTCEGSLNGKRWIKTYDLGYLKAWVIACNINTPKPATAAGIECKLSAPDIKIYKGFSTAALYFVRFVRDSIKSWSATTTPAQKEFNAPSESGLTFRASTNYSPRLHTPPRAETTDINLRDQYNEPLKKNDESRYKL